MRAKSAGKINFQTVDPYGTALVNPYRWHKEREQEIMSNSRNFRVKTAFCINRSCKGECKLCKTKERFIPSPTRDTRNRLRRDVLSQEFEIDDKDKVAKKRESYVN